MSDQYDGHELVRQVRMLREENERLRAERSAMIENVRFARERAERAEAGLDALGVAIVNAGYTWTPEMRSAYEKATNRKG